MRRRRVPYITARVEHAPRGTDGTQIQLATILATGLTRAGMDAEVAVAESKRKIVRNCMASLAQLGMKK